LSSARKLMLKSAPSPAMGGRPDAENKNPGGEAGVCHGTSDLLAGFFNVVRKPVGSNHHDVRKVMLAPTPVKRAIIKNHPDVV
jgi:hypothetical protein